MKLSERKQTYPYSSYNLIAQQEKESMQVHPASIKVTAKQTGNPYTCSKKETRQPNDGPEPNDGLEPLLPPRVVTPNTGSSRNYIQGVIGSHKTKRMSGLMGNAAISQSLQEIEDNNRLHELRLSMREELLSRLLKTQLGGPNASKQSPQMLAAFAKRLEEILFKTSKSLEAYNDKSTLDKRLQGLMVAMQQRKARSSRGGSTSTVPGVVARKRPFDKAPTALRKRAVLLKHLGHAKMVRVFKVVAEIKLIKLGREVTEGNPLIPIRECGQTGCSFQVPCQGEQKAPKEVRDLFFNTAIVEALEQFSADKIETIPWDQLLAQGEARVTAYHVWFRKRQAEMLKKSPCT